MTMIQQFANNNHDPVKHEVHDMILPRMADVVEEEVMMKSQKAIRCFLSTACKHLH
jgi:hypothetical protein